MSDQANKLRDTIRQLREERQAENSQIKTPLMELLQGDEQRSLAGKAKVFSITSGKGGVGKTNFAVSLAVYLSRAGKRVTIIDADFGLANIEVLFGVVPRLGFSDVINGSNKIEEVLTPGPLGISFISGGSGLSNMANLSSDQMEQIIQSFATLEKLTDIVIIDTGAGISKAVTGFVLAASQAIVVTTPEPTSIADAYAIVKATKEASRLQKLDMPDFKLVVNRVDSKAEGIEVFDKFSRACGKFLEISVEKLGVIPYDQSLVKAVKTQKPVAMAFPASASACAIEDICSRILYGFNSDESTEAVQTKGGLKSFARRLAGIFSK